MKTTFLLVRHGQSEANLKDVFAGHSGYSLTALGREQAARTAEYIKNTYPVDAVFSSDLPRAFQTAEYTARAFGLPITTDARFREIFAGSWEGVQFGRLEEEYPEDFAIWLKDIGNARCTDGESVKELIERVFSGLEAIADRGKCIVVVAHATPLRAALWKASDVSGVDIQKISWGSNCAISEFTLEDGKLSAVRVNYVGHLEGIETSLPENL
ncbi:MAG: histidine phosphatase family protein [Oscillospiraceae bacterium]|nr:histidine phosphatase family protein [Oscillospiraceae bacterium]